MVYLLDTNFIINYFKGIFKGDALKFTDSVISGTTFISVITRIELLGLTSNDEDLSLINDFISESVVFGLTEDIIQRTISLRKSKKIKLPDAVIAATALENNLQLLTLNVKDFKNISGLTIIDANKL